MELHLLQKLLQCINELESVFDYWSIDYTGDDSSLLLKWSWSTRINKIDTLNRTHIDNSIINNKQ